MSAAVSDTHRIFHQGNRFAVKPMRIERTTLLEIIKRAPALDRVPQRADLSKEILDLRAKIAKQSDQYIQPWLVLIDESLQFFVQFEKYQFAKPLKSNAVSFAILISKIKRDLVSIRELLLIGQDATSLIVARTFVEDLEIAMALALDSELCKAYSSNNDNSEFWNKNIGYGRVYDKMERFLLECGTSHDRAVAAVQQHREIKKFCSESTHGGMTSSLRSAFSPSLTEPDMFHHLSLGALSANTPKLCLFIAEECHMFSGSIIKSITGRKPLHLFRSYQPTSELFDAFASAYVLQELVVRYGEKLATMQSKFAWA